MNTYDENRLNDHPEIAPYFDDISASVAAGAYNHTSHSPDRAGSIIRADYARMLIADREEVVKNIKHAIAKCATVEEDWEKTIDSWFSSHRQGLKTRFLAYLSAHSCVASPFITGPARFPTARNQKRSDTADRRWEDVEKFQANSKKSILRALLPYGDGSAIRTDDPDALSKLKTEIQGLEDLQRRMKDANRIIRKHCKDRKRPESMEVQTAVIADLVGIGFAESTAKAIVSHSDYTGRIGFESYQLSNNNANIRRLKQRLEETAEIKQTEISDEFPGDVEATVTEDGKIQITFPGIPPQEVRTLLKSRAFKWSRARMAWVRKMTPNAIGDYQYHIKPALAAGI